MASMDLVRQTQVLPDPLRLPVERHRYCPSVASNTTTPTGEVSTSDSRSALVRCSTLVLAGALAIAAAACEAISRRISSSSSVNASAFSFPARMTISDRCAEVKHWHGQEGTGGRQAVRRQTCFAYVFGKVRPSERTGQIAYLFKELRPVGPIRQTPMLLVGETGGDEILELAGLVDGGDGAVARSGECAGTLHDFLEDVLEVQACTDTQDRLVERRVARAQRLYLPYRIVACTQGSDLSWMSTTRSFLPLRMFDIPAERTRNGFTENAPVIAVFCERRENARMILNIAVITHVCH